MDETVPYEDYVAIGRVSVTVAERLQEVEGVVHWHRRWLQKQDDDSPEKAGKSYLAGQSKRYGNWRFEYGDSDKIEYLRQVYNLGGWQAFLGAEAVVEGQREWEERR